MSPRDLFLLNGMVRDETPRVGLLAAESRGRVNWIGFNCAEIMKSHKEQHAVGNERETTAGGILLRRETPLWLWTRG